MNCRYSRKVVADSEAINVPQKPIFAPSSTSCVMARSLRASKRRVKDGSVTLHAPFHVARARSFTSVRVYARAMISLHRDVAQGEDNADIDRNYLPVQRQCGRTERQHDDCAAGEHATPSISPRDAAAARRPRP